MRRRGIALRGTDLTRVYRRRGLPDVAALSGVDLELPAGACAAVRGPSGCGKSTLLALLGGLDRPTAGQVLHDGTALDECSEAELARRRRRVGVLLQGAPLLRRLPLWENVTQGLVPLGTSAATRRRLALEWLERLAVAELADRPPEALSAGQAQRAALARALVGEPDLLLADEPTSQLDDESVTLVLAALEAARDEGRTLVIATHDHRVASLAHVTWRLRAGRLVHGTRGA